MSKEPFEKSWTKSKYKGMVCVYWQKFLSYNLNILVEKRKGGNPGLLKEGEPSLWKSDKNT